MKSIADEYVHMLCIGPLHKTLDEQSHVADVLRMTLVTLLEKTRADAYAEAHSKIGEQIAQTLLLSNMVGSQ